MVIVATDEFDKTLAHLNEHHKVIQSLKENNEIILKAQKNYKSLLKGLAEIGIYPEFIETRKSSLRDTYFNINQKGGK